MFFDGRQLAASILALFIASAVTAALIFHRKGSRRLGYGVLCVCAVLALESWIRFGDVHSLFIDADYSDVSPRRRKVEVHQPFHFHEFFHYYIASKYFQELGYESLYDCTAYADREIAQEENRPPRINGYVRDLSDVLVDKTYDEAVAHCQNDRRTHFTDARWASFKSDLRDLHHMVPDDWWNGVVYDAGFNPPPSWVLVGSAIANTIPIHIGKFPAYLVSTSLDVLLLIACFFVLRRAFGNATAILVPIYFGVSFISSYGWNGGAYLRFTWVSAVVFGLAAVKRERWALAGALFGAATCDRLFPAGFAIGAMIPVVYRAIRSQADRKIVLRFGAGFAGTTLTLFVVSCAVYGAGAWGIFFSRILRHGDIYYGMHIGLKKVLTYRDWVPSQNFQQHVGLINFKNWNLRLRDLWAHMRFFVIPLQLMIVAGIGYASIRRRPYEAGLLAGVCVMFFFNLPANYYFVILVLVPAFLFRAAATAPSPERRMREYIALTAFNTFWMATLFVSRMSNDVIIYDFYICFALMLFLFAWIATWIATPSRYPLKSSACQTVPPSRSSTESAASSGA
ncbi:MAG: hypothetical protein ACLQVI_02100 [Polyangiaceae bacterium]|jgi:hypothetical protein